MGRTGGCRQWLCTVAMSYGSSNLLDGGGFPSTVQEVVQEVVFHGNVKKSGEDSFAGKMTSQKGNK